MRYRPSFVPLLLVFAHCAPQAPPPETHEAIADFDSPLGDLTLRAGNTELVFDGLLRRDEHGFVLHGHTSRDLYGGGSTLCGHPQGDLSLPSPRTFDVRWPDASTVVGSPPSTLTLIAGDETVHAQPTIRPRVVRRSGGVAAVDGELTPLLSDGRVYYRVTGVTRAGDPFVRDLDGALLDDLAGSGRDLSLTFALPSGELQIEQVWIELAPKRIEASTDDLMEPRCEID